MKNAPTTYGNESALDKRKYTIEDHFPRRLDTILAAVLVWLLDDCAPLTAWDGVQVFSTRHIEAAIRTLKKKYGWPIETVWLPTRRADGTFFYVTAYKLPQAEIEYAYADLDLFAWFALVEAAQARRRARESAKAAALESYWIIGGNESFHTIPKYSHRR